MNMWTSLINELHARASLPGSDAVPYELIADTVMIQGRRINLSPNVFPITPLVQLLLDYYAENMANFSPSQRYWVFDIFLQLSVPYDALIKALETLFVSAPARIRPLASIGIYYVLQKWYDASVRGGGMLFDGGSIVDEMVELLRQLANSGLLSGSLDRAGMDEFVLFRTKVEAAAGR